MRAIEQTSRQLRTSSNRSATQALYRATMETLELRQLLAVVGIEATDAAATELGTTAGTFVLTRDDDMGELEVTVTVTGTAANGVDYKSIEETVTFEDESATANVTITPIQDTSFEGSESIIVTVEDGDDYDVDEDAESDTVTVADDEKPTISVTAMDSTAVEDDGEEIGTFKISRNGPEEGVGPVAAKVAISGTATNGTDYESIATTITIPDGETSIEVDLETKTDATYEATEKAIMTLVADATKYVISSTDKAAAISITDDELPTVKIAASDVNGLEGSATDTAKFTISRNTPLTDAVTVNYTITGSATNSTDYETITDSVTIAAGKASADVVIKTKQDTSVELGETVIITIDTDDAYGIDGASKKATVNLKDDDKPTVTMTASDKTASETGTSNQGKFTISRTGATTETLTVSLTAAGTGKTGVDYVALAKTVTIPVGKSSRVVEVKPIDDADLEGAETVIATLAAGTTYIIGSDKTGTVTISEDEVPDVTIVATDANAAEPGTDKGTLTVARNGPTTSALLVNYTITGTAADDGTDYTEIEESVTIPAGKASATISIVAKNDTEHEVSETVIITLDEDDAYDVDGDQDAGTVTVKDDEKATVTLTAMDAAAGEEGSATGAFKLSRTGPTADDLKVSLTITGTAAKAGVDYTALETSYVIPAGAGDKTIAVTPVDDSTLEADETVIATLAANVAYTIGTDKTATVTIDEDELPTVTIKATDATATEPTTDKAAITITRNGPTAAELDVTYTITGSAVNGTDYTELEETATIPAGKASLLVPIVPTEDSTVEGRETIVVTLDESEDELYLLDDDLDVANVNLNDNEKVTVTVTATDDDAVEDDDEDTITLKFARDVATIDATEVLYSITGFGTAGTDTEEVLTGKVNITATTAFATVTLTPTDDALVEGDETIIVTLKAATTYALGTDKAATVTIADDEQPEVSIKATDAVAKEGTTDGMVFTITRTGTTRNALAVDLDFSTSSTAGAGDLAAAFPDSVTIPANKAFVTLSVASKNDTTYEGSETVLVSVLESDDYNVDEDAIAANGKITDDELPTVLLDATDASAAEEDSVTGEFTFSRKAGEANTDAVVVVYTITGTGKNGKDYNKITKTVTIAAGEGEATVTVTPKEDTTVENNETVSLTMGKGSFKLDDAHKTGTVTILDEQKTTISIEALDTPVDETDTIGAHFRIWRTGQTTGVPLVVEFDLSGSAAAGDDFSIVDADGEEVEDTITIAAGQAYVDIFIVPVDNDDESDKTVVMTLSSASAYNIDSGADDATIDITDDDA